MRARSEHHVGPTARGRWRRPPGRERRRPLSAGHTPPPVLPLAADPVSPPSPPGDARLLLRLASGQIAGRRTAPARPRPGAPPPRASGGRPRGSIRRRPWPTRRAPARRPASTASVRLLIPWPWRAGV